MRVNVENINLNQDYTINLIFSNGESKVFDVKPFLDKGRFSELKNLDLFFSAKIVDGAVEWSNSVDLSPDTLYLLGA